MYTGETNSVSAGSRRHVCHKGAADASSPVSLSLSPLSDLGNKFLSLLKVLRSSVVKMLGLICVSKAHLIINPFHNTGQHPVIL